MKQDTKMDKQMLDIRNYIQSHHLIEKGDHVLVGLSGGPDSVFLLYVLNRFKDSLGYKLYALHVHHGIRGEEADRDMRFSEELCKSFGIPFEKTFVDAPGLAGAKGMSLEEAARVLRYEAFEKTRKEIEDRAKAETENGNAARCVIAVAHHMDDQAETVLHNLVRGSGIRGLSGMEPKRGHIIRPLLSVKREYILSKLKDNDISYVIDSTNLDTQYTRNHIRSEILPELREINPEASAHIAHTADILREAEGFFARLASEYADKYAEIKDSDMKGQAGMEISIPVTELKSYPELVRQYVMIELIRRIGIPLKDWGSVHFRDLDRLIYGPGNAHLDLPYKMSADYRKKHLILRINQEIISIKRRKNNDGACKSTDS